jgi:ribokinase
VVIGSINVDLFAHVQRHPVPGETVLGTGGHRAPGGKGANQALAARLQGAEVSLVGAIGDDGDAGVALALLREAGVDLSGVAVLEGLPTGLAVITVADDGENTIVVVSGANAALPVEHALAAVAGLGGEDIVLVQGELSPEVTARSVTAAAARGHRVVYNLAPYTEMPDAVLLQADPLVLNEVEAAAVARQLGVPGGDEEQTGRDLVAVGVQSVVVTRGARGCLVADDSGVLVIPAVPVEAVDTTGAGDAFAGALTARLAAGDPLRAAATHATRVGAYAVGRRGAQPSYPSRIEELP